MIVTDYNQMTVEELRAIHENLGIDFLVENGKITGIVQGGEENGK